MMNARTAEQWIAFTCRTTIAAVQAVNFTDDQIAWLGEHLADNKLINPPRDIPTKTKAFTCRKCGRGFIDTYRTKKPQYCQNCRR